jgi:hypothetical protein
MANYKNPQKISFTKEEEKRFRQLFNQWGASVEGYNRHDLGDSLKIIEVWDSPLYRSVLKTQYDKRLLKNTYDRIKGRIPSRSTVCQESDIDRWKIVPYPNDFTSKDTFYNISGTDYISDCPTCNATGKVICPECGGKGVIEQKITIKEVCPICYGRGYKTETKEYFDYERVWDNYQEKYVLRHVRKTREDKKTCYKCNGTGKVETFSYKEIPCKTCNTTGKVTCGSCGGDKKVLKYWQLHLIQYTKNYIDYLFPSLFSQDEIGKMSKLIDGDTPWKVIERVRIDRDDFKQASLDSRPVVGDMLSKLPVYIERSSHTTVCFNDVELCECSAKTVIYEVDGNRFSCMIVGDSWKLFTVTSPMSQKMDDLKTRVNHYCKKRQFGQAWAVLQKVNKYPQAGSNEAYMQQQLEERMATSAKFGINLSVVICTMLSAPIFYTLYYHYDFFAPWSTWLMEKWDITPKFIMAISLAFVMYKGMKSRKSKIPAFTYRVASSTMRFIRGFILGIWNFIIYSMIALLLSYTGVSVLAAGAIFLVTYIIALIIILIVGLIQ